MEVCDVAVKKKWYYFKKKPFWKSKTFYGAVIIFIAGGLAALGYDSQWLLAFGAALGLIGVRKSLK